MLEQINKENFQQMLNQFSTPELEGMIEKFPYFQQAHLLLAKKYQQENSPKFDQQLQLAALYIQDRELLYTLFNEKSATASSASHPITEPVKVVEEKKEEIFEIVPPVPEVTIIAQADTVEVNPPVEKVTLEVSPEETDMKHQLELIEESARQLTQLTEPKEEEQPIVEAAQPVTEEVQTETPETTVPVEKVTEEVNPEDEDLKLQIQLIEESALSLNQFVETPVEEKPEIEATQPVADEVQTENPVITPPVEKVTEEVSLEDADLKLQIQLIEESALTLSQFIETPVEEKPEVEAAQSGEEEQKDHLVQAHAEEPEEPATEQFNEEEKPLETFSRIEPHTFDEWLKAFNNKSKPEIKEKPVEEEPVAPPAAEDDELTKLLASSGAVDYLHELVKEETTYAKGLERFIEEQIQKHKQPETRKTTPEIDLNTDPATETMAKVYEMQKKYSKAIKTYEALMLKFPEKSSLFAARINYLKNIV